MNAPPTEDDARVLLARAAATIDVDDGVPTTLARLPEPRQRRWPVAAAAAAAVVAAAGGGFLVSQQLGDDGQDGPAGSGRPSVGRAPDDGLPSLVGLTEDEATALLQDLGHAVEVRVVPDGCNVTGIVTGTRPAAGAQVAPGDPVTVRVVGDQDVVDCVGEIPWSIVWDVVRAARGLEDPPSLRGADFPEDVRAAVEEMVTAPAGRTAELDAAWAFDGHTCWAGRGDRIRFFLRPGRDDLVCPARSVLVELGGETVRSVRVEDPVVEDVTEEELMAGLERLSAASRFFAWARFDARAPAFADRVRVMYDGRPAPGSTGWVDDAEDRSAYAGCSGLGFPDCGLDPVALLLRHDGDLLPMDGRSTCADGGEVPERFAEAVEDVVRLEQPGPATCRDAWAVELWIDEDGVIYGVNQAGG